MGSQVPPIYYPFMRIFEAKLMLIKGEWKGGVVQGEVFGKPMNCTTRQSPQGYWYIDNPMNKIYFGLLGAPES